MDKLKRTILKAIQEGVIPTKYSYLKSGSDVHLEHSHSDSYLSVVGPFHLTSAMAGILPKSQVSTSCIELGYGNGERTVEFYSELIRSGILPSVLHCFDFTSISAGMDLIISALGDKVDVLFHHADVEYKLDLDALDKHSVANDRLIVTMLGSTLGNVEDDLFVLRRIANHLANNSIFVFSLSLFDPRTDALAGYDTSAFRQGIQTPFLLAGIPLDAIAIRTDWDASEHSVISIAQFIRDVRIEGHEISRNKLVRCFISRRYTEERVGSLLSKAGLEVHSKIISHNVGVYAVRKSNGARNTY